VKFLGSIHIVKATFSEGSLLLCTPKCSVFLSLYALGHSLEYEGEMFGFERLPLNVRVRFLMNWAILILIVFGGSLPPSNVFSEMEDPTGLLTVFHLPYRQDKRRPRE